MGRKSLFEENTLKTKNRIGQMWIAFGHLIIVVDSKKKPNEMSYQCFDLDSYKSIQLYEGLYEEGSWEEIPSCYTRIS